MTVRRAQVPQMRLEKKDRRKIMKKLISSGLAVMLLCGVLGGCGSQGPAADTGTAAGTGTAAALP